MMQVFVMFSMYIISVYLDVVLSFSVPGCCTQFQCTWMLYSVSVYLDVVLSFSVPRMLYSVATLLL